MGGGGGHSLGGSRILEGGGAWASILEGVLVNYKFLRAPFFSPFLSMKTGWGVRPLDPIIEIHGSRTFPRGISPRHPPPDIFPPAPPPLGISPARTFPRAYNYYIWDMKIGVPYGVMSEGEMPGGRYPGGRYPGGRCPGGDARGRCPGGDTLGGDTLGEMPGGRCHVTETH